MGPPLLSPLCFVTFLTKGDECESEGPGVSSHVTSELSRARTPAWPGQSGRKDPIITTDLHLLAISASIETTIRNVKIHHQTNGGNESFL